MRTIISLLFPLLLLSCGGGAYTPGQVAGSPGLTPPAQPGPSDSYWQMDEHTRLYHFAQGDPEGRPVLIVHGGPGIPVQEPWPGLEGIEGFRFHYYHQRGCGSSTIPFHSFDGSYPENMKALEKQLGLARHLEDMERIRRILGEEKLILIGHSFGGFLAALYALEFPGRVEKLILVEPADMLRFPPAHGGMDQIRTWLSEEQETEYDAFLKEYFNYRVFFKRTEEELARLNGQYGPFYRQAMENRFPGHAFPAGSLDTEGAGGFGTHALYFSLGRKYDYREEMGEVDLPALVIHGKKDLYGPETAREWAEILPGSVYNELEDSSHFPFREEPEAFRQLLESWLNS